MPYSKIAEQLDGMGIGQVNSWPNAISLLRFDNKEGSFRAWHLLFQQSGVGTLTLAYRIEVNRNFTPETVWKALYVYHSLAVHGGLQEFNSEHNWNLHLFRRAEKKFDVKLSRLSDPQIKKAAEWIVANTASILERKARFENALALAESLSGIDRIEDTSIRENVERDIAKWYIANASSFKVDKEYKPTPEDIKKALGDMKNHMQQTAEQLRKEKPFQNNTLMYKSKRNLIWAGAPGTGKSYTLNKKAKELFTTTRVTFHPEYTYYDFVGTYRPKADKDNTQNPITYAFVPGPFAKMLKKALWNTEQQFCLIIEEINRANAAAVFGDVFQLLDRDSSGKSEYAICPSEELADYLLDPKDMEGTKPEEYLKQELHLPSNLYLWATMNSADQGCFPMDTAFKRRWSFEHMKLDPADDEIEDEGKRWNQIRQGINELLLEHHVPEDKLMGYYFLNKEERTNKVNLINALKGKVLLYLFEDAAKPYKNLIFKRGLNTYGKLRENLSIDAKEDLGVFAKRLWDADGKPLNNHDA